MSRKNRKSLQFRTDTASLIESLEHRRMLTVTYDAVTDTVNLDGSLGVDIYAISMLNKGAGSFFKVVENGVIHTFNQATQPVLHLTADLKDGSDAIVMQASLTQDLRADCGIGGDVVYGAAGNDFIDGDFDNDAIFGRDGNDTVIGSAGRDFVHGDNGDDVITGDSDNDTLYGDEGYDNIDGGRDSDDLIHGGTEDDTLNGSEGNDTVYGEEGNDKIYGETGEDSLMGDSGNDTLEGGDQNDYLDGGTEDDTLKGQANADQLVGGDGNDSLEGNDGPDTLYGSEGKDTLSGGEMNDLLNGDEGQDSLYGNDGADTLNGGDNDDSLDGGDHDDLLDGDRGDDTLSGGAGDDDLTGDVGEDELHGGADDDTLHGNDGDDELHGDAGNDLVKGEHDDDRVFGDAGDDTLEGGDGNDNLFAGEGTDTLEGGDGDDILVSIDDDDTDSLLGEAGFDSFWVDRTGLFSTDEIADSDANEEETNVHKVEEFENGADRSLDGDFIADPVGGDNWGNYADHPLFGSLGPVLTDVHQGNLADCWFMSSIASAVNVNANVARQLVADLGDGTYVVQINQKQYRVDADLAFKEGDTTDLEFAGFGHDDSIWVPIVEKAWALYRDGTYDSLNNDTPYFCLGKIGGNDRLFGPVNNLTAEPALIALDLLNQAAVTCSKIGDGSTEVLTDSHCYALVGVGYDPFTLLPISVTLYNPYGEDRGVDYDDGADDGFVTITIDQWIHDAQDPVGLITANFSKYG
jgi:Ca2+-binding RTX toxin-like protein